MSDAALIVIQLVALFVGSLGAGLIVAATMAALTRPYRKH